MHQVELISGSSCSTREEYRLPIDIQDKVVDCGGTSEDDLNIAGHGEVSFVVGIIP